MRVMPKRCMFLVLAFICLQATLVYAQDSDNDEERMRLIAERWDYKKLETEYPMNGPKVFKIIERCYPNEIDTLIAKGDAERAKRKWNKANLYYAIVLMSDPDNLAANYGRGICKREYGRNLVLLFRWNAWKVARKSFECVIRIDSTYKDVFYQYAILERYDENHFKAIELTHRQLDVKDTLHHVQIGIFRFYDSMIHHKKARKAEEWLKSRKTIYDIYFLGELYRITDRLEESDSVVQSVIRKPEDLPLPPVYLSMVKLYVQSNLPEKAENTYWKAVDSVTNKLDAELLLEDFMYIVNTEEYDLLNKNLSLELLPEALRVMWLKRNPLPSTPVNVRLIEHYRRIIYTEEHFFYDDFRHRMYKEDMVGDLRFPQWYDENYKFSDPGLIYIRFGEPDDRITYILKEKSTRYLAWLYHSANEQPQMIFQFMIPEVAPPNYWTLVPIVRVGGLLLELSQWDHRYYAMLRSDTQSLYHSMERQVKLERAEEVDHVFRNDRHTWPKETEELEMYQSIYRFRQDENEDIIQLAYAVPISNLFDGKTKKDSVTLETGATIFGGGAEPLFKEVRTFKIEDESDPYVLNDFFIHEFELPLSLKPHNITLHARVPEENKLNGWRGVYDLTCPNRDKLACSTLKLAYHISPTTKSEERHRNGLKIIPNPTKTFDKNDPVYIYYEIYNLTYSDRGSTDYTVTFTLREPEKKEKLLRKVTGIFGSGEKYEISVESNQMGTSRTVADYISFDMGKARKGEYELMLEVKDNVGREEASGLIDLKLF